MRRPTIRLTALALMIAALVTLTHSVRGNAQDAGAPPARIATIDLLGLLEDMLQTDAYKPDRDEFRGEWESKIKDMQDSLAQIEGELRLASPTDPNTRQLQQRYQQTGYQYQQLQRQAGMEFDRFSADQAASAYAMLHEKAAELAAELGYTHLIASRRSGEIADRGSLATVTQEILARGVILSPSADDLTETLRDRLSIPVRPKPESAQPATDMPNADAETPDSGDSNPGTPTSTKNGGDDGENGTDNDG